MASSKRPSIEELAEFDEQTLQNFARLDREAQLEMIRHCRASSRSSIHTAAARRQAESRMKQLQSLYRKLHRKPPSP